MSDCKCTENTKKTAIADSLLDWTLTMGLTVIICFGISIFFRTVIVSGESMEPNYHNREVLLVRMNTDPASLEYGDVVIVQKSDYEVIKRIIGLPGDKVTCRKGILYRNGKKINESYIKEKQKREFSYDVPEKSVFICGDNRNNSLDSRYYGPVSYERIQGKVLTRLFQLPDSH